MGEETITNARTYEKSLLVAICEMLEKQGTPNFGEGEGSSDFGVVHGALRSAYNGIGELMGLPLAPDRIIKLEEQGSKIFKARNALVHGVEVDRREFRGLAEELDSASEIQKIAETLRGYAAVWYGEAES